MCRHTSEFTGCTTCTGSPNNLLLYYRSHKTRFCVVYEMYAVIKMYQCKTLAINDTLSQIKISFYDKIILKYIYFVTAKFLFTSSPAAIAPFMVSCSEEFQHSNHVTDLCFGWQQGSSRLSNFD